MMQEHRIVTALDVGTTKVCAIIASTSGSGLPKILGHSVVPCHGLNKGNVEDVIATQRSIRDAIERAEGMAGVKVNSAYVGVTGAHVSFENRRDVLRDFVKHGVITGEDIENVPKTVASTSKVYGRKVIHALPMNYYLDGREGIKDPLGMHSRELEVETHIVTGASLTVDRLESAVEGAGLSVDGLILEPLASAEAVLKPIEKLKGAAVVDIGGGTTDVVVFKGGSMYYVGVIPIGGFQFTNDLCLTYNAPFEDAEHTKLTYSHTEPDIVGPNEEIEMAVIGKSTALSVPLRDVCLLTRERAQELLRMIVLKLKDADIPDISEFQLVLTGGAANLSGFEQMIKRTLTSHVRIGSPDSAPGIPDELRHPQFATAVGMVSWINSQIPTNGAVKVNGNGNGTHEEVTVKEPVGAGGGGKSRFFNPFKRR